MAYDLLKLADTLGSDWSEIIVPELQKPYMQDLSAFLQQESQSGKTIFPAEQNVFNALQTIAFSDIKVVILGQDPYHGVGQAHGLSFSVQEGVKLPPSLRNIYKEISAEYGVSILTSGDLTHWARQGVLLLNATLTVEEGQAGAHQKRGWEDFTDHIIRTVATRHTHVVFMLWGSYAQKKSALIDTGQHLVLEAPHPSPLSAHRGFLGCGHFKLANDYLQNHKKIPIQWY